MKAPTGCLDQTSLVSGMYTADGLTHDGHDGIKAKPTLGPVPQLPAVSSAGAPGNLEAR